MQGAAYLGYKLVSRTTEEVRVEIHGALHIFDVLATLEFNSDRKRMSIIVRTPDSRVLLMCKGADSIILKRLAAGEPGVETVMKHLVSTVTSCPPAWCPLAPCKHKRDLHKPAAIDHRNESHSYWCIRAPEAGTVRP